MDSNLLKPMKRFSKPTPQSSTLKQITFSQIRNKFRIQNQIKNSNPPQGNPGFVVHRGPIRLQRKTWTVIWKITLRKHLHLCISRLISSKRKRVNCRKNYMSFKRGIISTLCNAVAKILGTCMNKKHNHLSR